MTHSWSLWLICCYSICSSTQQNYEVLLILTDGQLSDKIETKKAIIEASAAPLSIIIVGVGKDDFSDLHELDSDGRLLSEGSEQCLRDIVQFVPYEAAMGQGHASLAEEVLKELPDQILGYYASKNIYPN